MGTITAREKEKITTTDTDVTNVGIATASIIDITDEQIQKLKEQEEEGGAGGGEEEEEIDVDIVTASPAATSSSTTTMTTIPASLSKNNVTINHLISIVESYTSMALDYYFPDEGEMMIGVVDNSNGLTPIDWARADYTCKKLPKNKRFFTT